MNLIKAGTQQPKSFIRPSEKENRKKKNVCLLGVGGWHSIDSAYVTFGFPESTVTGQISIRGRQWKGLTCSPVFCQNEFSSQPSRPQPLGFLASLALLPRQECLKSERNVLFPWPAWVPGAPNASPVWALTSCDENWPEAVPRLLTWYPLRQVLPFFGKERGQRG